MSAVLPYRPVKRKFVSESAETNKLLKRKRILEFVTNATAEEWLDLANDFLADNCRANHCYCMMEFKRLGGEIMPIQFHYIPPEPESPAPDWMERKDIG